MANQLPTRGCVSERLLSPLRLAIPSRPAQLDSRWTRSDATTRASLDANGLALIPGAHGVAALMQAASEGDMTLTAQVARPDTLHGEGSVGLVLYEDDGDWLTLMVDHTGKVSLCPMAQQEAVTCMTGKAVANTAVWLRIARSASTFTALVSADGVSWQQVAQWTPTLTGAVGPRAAQTPTPQTPASATPAKTTTATPQASQTPGATATGATDPAAAPLAFSSWGVVAMGASNATGWPHITDFTVSPAP